MGTVAAVRPPQTLYVTIRRDELRQLRDEREALLLQVAQLREALQGQSLTAHDPLSRLGN
ncbi:DUF6026 family protein [Pseudomonas fuscovaginae UPB0736]|uniref:Uncharacterized protein n=1 Tax=Pseudomonas asplenii TaxID=53407 RepID=A0A1H1ZXB8_9PSED|nr:MULTISPECIES: DUF6026 family protein [Pseudomonas]UUQ65796.1 DUF6026 family protein [Pseudomonas fuscovaginae UPB0736]UZE30976.1 DUF6026 family protein [Pseudomonas asplenii]SDT38207.1 hypothetical protein SAMN05216598_5376 [Pseudomonas asplenii]SEI16190.1 hypothetical protein SAMN05216581_3113 [Pseudomonas fuscovaginae]